MISDLNIRPETREDWTAVERLVQESFKDEKFSDGREPELVRLLRGSGNYIQDLSLVAEVNGDLVGYILLTMVKIRYEAGWQPSLALAPLAVDPARQKKGIGSALVEEAHAKARDLGYPSVIVIGHEEYYPRFGYRPLDDFRIRIPFDIPSKYCFIKHLRKECRLHTDGSVEYGDAFFA